MCYFFEANIFGHSFETFSPLEYIRTFIPIVRFQQIYSNVFIEQNKTFYATNVKIFDLKKKKLTYYIIKISPYFAFKFIGTFICEYSNCTNRFGYSFMKNVDDQIYLDILL